MRNRILAGILLAGVCFGQVPIAMKVNGDAPGLSIADLEIYERSAGVGGGVAMPRCMAEEGECQFTI